MSWEVSQVLEGKKCGKDISPHLIKLEDDFVNNGANLVRIGDLFEVSTGSQVAAKSLKDGIIYRVSAKSDNNGIIGTYNMENIKSARHFNNFISVNFLEIVLSSVQSQC